MTTQVVSIEEFADILRRFPKKFERLAVKGLRSAALRTKVEVVHQIDHASPRPAVDTGLMRRSVEVDNLEDGALLSVGAPYAAAMEEGSRPHFPPLAPLIEWVKRKGLAGKKPRGAAKASALAAQGFKVSRADARKIKKAADYDEEARSIAFAIALHISKHGTEPRRFFAKAMAKAPMFISMAMEQEIAEMEK